MSFPLYPRRAVAAAFALTLTACAGDSSTPTSPASTIQGSSAVRNSTSNGVRYRNNGVKPATGRSGSAALEARALLGKDGNTVIEATTGSLEAGTKPGKLERVQVKVLGTESTKNFNGLNAAGYFTTTYPALLAHSNLQVQANVKGIDPKRTDVVTVTTPVARRPDIAVTAVSNSATSTPNTMVTITAPVQELNGDVGARTDCVLSVNGSVVDDAEGIWVDAGGSVACQFAHTFTDPGTYEISISATGVNPGDWDTDNNSASSSITISTPGIRTGGMQAYQYVYDDYYRQTNNGGYYYSGYGYRDYYREQHANYSTANTWAQDQQPFGNFQRVDAVVSTNGTETLRRSIPFTYSYSNDYGSYTQACSYSNEMGLWAQACSIAYLDGTGYTDYNFQYQSGTVTYYGNDFYCDYYYSYCNSYTWNYSDVYLSGVSNAWAPGTTVGLSLSFVDNAGRAHDINKSVTLDQQNAWNYDNNGYCYYDYYYGNTCYTQRQNGYQWYGYINW
jgi:hypothetical protein